MGLGLCYVDDVGTPCFATTAIDLLIKKACCSLAQFIQPKAFLKRQIGRCVNSSMMVLLLLLLLLLGVVVLAIFVSVKTGGYNYADGCQGDVGGGGAG